MLLRFRKADSFRSIAGALHQQLNLHHQVLKAAPARPHKILTTFCNFMQSQPLEHEGNDFIDNPQSWQGWTRWARSFEYSLRDNALDFANRVLISKAYSISEKNRESIGIILDNAYHAALCLRIASALNTGTEERNRAMECCLLSLIKRSINDARDLCIESFGISPEIHLDLSRLNEIKAFKDVVFERQDLHLNLIGVESQLRFVFVELLQNACRATIEKYGLLNVEDDAHAVNVSLGASSMGHYRILVQVEDDGMGMHHEGCRLATDYFFRNFTPEIVLERSHYRQFGLPFSGIGLGLPMAKVYIKFHGGALAIKPSKNGVVSQIHL